MKSKMAAGSVLMGPRTKIEKEDAVRQQEQSAKRQLDRCPPPFTSFSSAPEQFLFRLPVDLRFNCILRLHFAKLIGAKG